MLEPREDVGELPGQPMSLREIDETEDEELPTRPRVRVIDGSSAPKRIHEEVLRLEAKDEPLQVQRIDRLQAAMGGAVRAPVDERPEKKKRAWAWGLAAGGLCLGVIGVVAGMVYHFAVGDAEGETFLEKFAMEEGVEAIEKGADEGLTKRVDQAWALLETMTATMGAGESRALLRGQGAMPDEWIEWWKGLELPLRSEVTVESGPGDDGAKEWFSLSITPAGRSPVEAVFVVEEGRVLLDWEATHAVGEMRFEDLPDLEEGREVGMRLVVSPDHYHDNRYPEAMWFCYRFSDGRGGEHGWLYARRGSAAARAMEGELMRSSELVKEPMSSRVRVRMRNGGLGGRRQFELTKVEGLSWIKGFKDL